MDYFSVVVEVPGRLPRSFPFKSGPAFHNTTDLFLRGFLDQVSNRNSQDRPCSMQLGCWFMATFMQYLRVGLGFRPTMAML
jgi:hypothetical protein